MSFGFRGCRGADAPSPHAGVYGRGKKGRGLVPGEAKSDVEVVVIRVENVAAVRRTHPPRNAGPRTPAKGVFTGRNLALLLTPVIASLHTYTVAFSFEYTLTKTSTEKLVGEEE